MCSRLLPPAGAWYRVVARGCRRAVSKRSGVLRGCRTVSYGSQPEGGQFGFQPGKSDGANGSAVRGGLSATGSAVVVFGVFSTRRWSCVFAVVFGGFVVCGLRGWWGWCMFVSCCRSASGSCFCGVVPGLVVCGGLRTQECVVLLTSFIVNDCQSDSRFGFSGVHEGG